MALPSRLRIACEASYDTIALQAAETCEASVLCGWVVWGVFKNHNKIFCAQMDYGLLDFLSRYGRSL